MQITLNIKDETEFLAEVKELIRAQIKLIAREDIRKIYENDVTEAVRKFIDNSKKTLEASFESKMNSQAKEVVSWAIDNHGQFWKNSDFVKDKATEILKDMLPEVLKKKVKLEDIIADVKKDFVKKLLDK